MLGCSTEYHLPQSTLGKGALNQKIAGRCLGSAQNGFTGIFAIERYGQRLCRNLVPLQIFDHLLRGRTRYSSSSSDRQDYNAFSPLKKRHCKSNGARLLCATVVPSENVIRKLLCTIPGANSLSANRLRAAQEIFQK